MIRLTKHSTDCFELAPLGPGYPTRMYSCCEDLPLAVRIAATLLDILGDRTEIVGVGRVLEIGRRWDIEVEGLGAAVSLGDADDHDDATQRYTSGLSPSFAS